MKIKEISERIADHLIRFEADIEINKPLPKLNHTTPYYSPNAWGAGRYVGVRYVAYQGHSYLSKADALEYLKWLDAGNVGRHYKALSFNTRLGK